MARSSFVVLVPAHNESGRIGAVITAALRSLAKPVRITIV